MADKNSWICESERTLIHSPVMEIVEQRCRSSEAPADGSETRRHDFYVFRARDWCNVIPVTEDGKIVLVRQYRIGNGQHTLEIPGGVADPGDRDPAASALREMTEETGYVPLPGARCIPIGSTYPNPAIQNNRCHSFVVGPVRRTQAQDLDPGEMIEVLEVPIDELVTRLAHGEVSHALIFNAFLLLAFRSPEARQALAETLRGYTRPEPA